MPPIKRALISVFDKTGIVKFAETLKKYHVEIISTGGTAKHLHQHGIQTISVSDITSFPEILGGRVKTLHPRIFGGLLSLRDNEQQMREIQQHKIDLIDLVVVNLYPFEKTIANPEVETVTALENIDIGGPCMIRAAAKNYLSVAVVTSPEQYDTTISELEQNNGELTLETRKKLAASAYAATSQYDSAIYNYLKEKSVEKTFPQKIQMNLAKVQDLRYGENPHQKAALYQDMSEITSGLLKAKKLQGKELSYNNFIDADAALGIIREFTEPCVAIIKHTNPCGVAIGDSLHAAYLNAKATDPVSAFGGIVGLNRKLDAQTAKAIAEVFTEVIIAPGYEPEALEILQTKKNLRLLQIPDISDSMDSFQIKKIQGGVLVQDQDFFNINDINFEVVSTRKPGKNEWTALRFGWRVCKWVKSNAIVYATYDRTIGIGAGQMSRVDSSGIAVEKAKSMGLSLSGTILASDAFFPFRDGVDVAAEVGTTAIIQPGGSVRDDEVIAAANEHNMAMVFTGVRHFRH